MDKGARLCHSLGDWWGFSDVPVPSPCSLFDLCRLRVQIRLYNHAERVQGCSVLIWPSPRSDHGLACPGIWRRTLWRRQCSLLAWADGDGTTCTQTLLGLNRGLTRAFLVRTIPIVGVSKVTVIWQNWSMSPTFCKHFGTFALCSLGHRHLRSFDTPYARTTCPCH